MRLIPKILISLTIFLVTLGALLYFKAQMSPGNPAQSAVQKWRKIDPGNLKLYPELYELMLHPLSESIQDIYFDSKLISSTPISINSFGLRDRAKETAKKSHFIIAGCSFVFGHGVEFKDVISTQLGLLIPEVNVRNIGHPAGGLHTSLRYLEIVDPRQWAPEPKGHFVFVSIHDHFARFLHHPSYLFWAPGISPYYVRENGSVKYVGTLETNRRYQIMQFLKDFGLEGFFPSSEETYSEEKIIFFVDGVVELKRRYLEKYPEGKFTWVMHPLSGFNSAYAQKVRELSKAKNLEFIELQNTMNRMYRNNKAKPEEQHLPHDLHPSPVSNKLFAGWMNWRFFSKRPVKR